MRVRRIVSHFMLALALGGTAFAHGTGKHLMGTAESVSGERLVVKDRAGGTHDVVLGPKTRYRDSAGGAAKAAELKPGDRIVVHLAGQRADAPAVEVRFSHPAAAASK